MAKHINHLRCGLCKDKITYKENGEINHKTFFEIKRSNCSFEEVEGYLNIDEENNKMSVHICKECFDKILNESKTLSRYFYNKFARCIIY